MYIDIVPVVIYGAGMVSSKTQGFYIKRGLIMTRSMKRVPYGDKSFGEYIKSYFGKESN